LIVVLCLLLIILLFLLLLLLLPRLVLLLLSAVVLLIVSIIVVVVIIVVPSSLVSLSRPLSKGPSSTLSGTTTSLAITWLVNTLLLVVISLNLGIILTLILLASLSDPFGALVNLLKDIRKMVVYACLKGPNISSWKKSTETIYIASPSKSVSIVVSPTTSGS
jgi:hypothetical protein